MKSLVEVIFLPICLSTPGETHPLFLRGDPDRSSWRMPLVACQWWFEMIKAMGFDDLPILVMTT